MIPTTPREAVDAIARIRLATNMFLGRSATWITPSACSPTSPRPWPTARTRTPPPWTRRSPEPPAPPTSTHPADNLNVRGRPGDCRRHFHISRATLILGVLPSLGRELTPPLRLRHHRSGKAGPRTRDHQLAAPPPTPPSSSEKTPISTPSSLSPPLQFPDGETLQAIVVPLLQSEAQDLLTLLYGPTPDEEWAQRQ